MSYMSAKSEIYSWRLSPRLKADLEEAARAEDKSLAALLEQIAREWLARSKIQGADEEELQRRLHEAGMKAVGAVHGGHPDRAANAASEVRKRIAQRHA
jgi:vacuolar-type H+-ATPase subunit C/Vma6